MHAEFIRRFWLRQRKYLGFRENMEACSRRFSVYDDDDDDDGN